MCTINLWLWNMLSPHRWHSISVHNLCMNQEHITIIKNITPTYNIAELRQHVMPQYWGLWWCLGVVRWPQVTPVWNRVNEIQKKRNMRQLGIKTMSSSRIWCAIMMWQNMRSCGDVRVPIEACVSSILYLHRHSSHTHKHPSSQQWKSPPMPETTCCTCQTQAPTTLRQVKQPAAPPLAPNEYTHLIHTFSCTDTPTFWSKKHVISVLLVQTRQKLSQFVRTCMAHDGIHRGESRKYVMSIINDENEVKLGSCTNRKCNSTPKPAVPNHHNTQKTVSPAYMHYL